MKTKKVTFNGFGTSEVKLIPDNVTIKPYLIKYNKNIKKVWCDKETINLIKQLQAENEELKDRIDKSIKLINKLESKEVYFNGLCDISDDLILHEEDINYIVDVLRGKI